MQPLLDALESLGAKCSSSNGNPPISISGENKGRRSQNTWKYFKSVYFSFNDHCSKIRKWSHVLNIQGKLVSKPYIDATITAMMKKFGVQVETKTPYKKYIIPEQNYRGHNFDYTI